MRKRYMYSRGNEIDSNNYLAVVSSTDENVNGTILVIRNAQGVKFKAINTRDHEKLVEYFKAQGFDVYEEILQPGEVMNIQELEGSNVITYTIGEAESKKRNFLQIKKQVAELSNSNESVAEDENI